MQIKSLIDALDIIREAQLKAVKHHPIWQVLYSVETRLNQQLSAAIRSELMSEQEVA